MLTINDLSFSYHKKNILNHVNLEIHQGDCIGIVGANGCGKSTLLSIIAGAKKAASGTITLNQTPLIADPIKRISTIGYVPQDNPLIPDLTVRDNLFMWFHGNRKSFQSEIQNGFLHILGISDMLSTTVNKLSGGMKKRVSLGLALQNHPTLLILDEPSVALDLVCKADIRHYLSIYLSNGGTILITTHEESELSLCNKLYLLKQGLLHQLSPTIRGEELINYIKA